MFKLRYFIICAVLLSITSPSPSQEVEYINSLGWTHLNDITVVNNTAYCLFQNGFVILDVTDPSSPQIISKTYLPGGNYLYNYYSFALKDHYAYIANGLSGVYVLDISDLYNPEIVANFSIPYYAQGIDIMGNYAIIAGSYGIYVYDITSPEQPEYVSRQEPLGGEKILILENYAYMIESSTGLYVFDLSDPTDPERVGGYGTQNSGEGLFIQDDYLYLSGHSNGLLLFNITDRIEPRLVSTYPVRFQSVGVFAIDTLVYSTNANKMEIINFADPEMPFALGEYDLSGSERIIYIEDDIAYVSLSQSGFNTLNISDPENPELLGGYNESNNIINSIYVKDDILYTAGINIYDISDPYHPNTLCDWALYSNDIIVRDTLAFLARGAYGFDIVNISDPVNPAILWSNTYSYAFMDVCIQDNVMYLSEEQGNLIIYDITNPVTPEMLNCYNPEQDYLRSTMVYDTLAFLSLFNRGLEILDISDPTQPMLLGNFYDEYYSPYNIVKRDNYIYVAYGWQFKILDISDPTSPTELSSLAMNSSTRNITIKSNYAYLAGDDLYVIDICDPYNPCVVESYQTPGDSKNVFADDNYIYVADYYSVLILDHYTTDIDINSTSLPSTYLLSSNYPNPFNASTTISYDIPSPGEVQIDIYDILGRKIETLVNGYHQAGSYSIIWNAEDLSSGMYLYKIQTGEFNQAQKCLLIK